MITVLITRPINSAIVLAKKIKASLSQINPVIFPAIEIRDIPEHPFRDTHWNTVDALIFTSPAAVEKSSQYLSKLSLPSSIQLFAPGEDTAQKIKEYYGGSAYFPLKNFNSQALLALPELQHIEKKQILLCQGQHSSSILSDTLVKRGANIRKIIIYTTHLPVPKNTPNLDTVDLITCTSSQSLHNLLELLGEPLKKKSLLVSSEKLYSLAKELGFSAPLYLAKNAGDEAIIEAIRVFKHP